MADRQSITAFLNQAAGGDVDAADQVWSAVYDELRHIAARELRREADGGTLSTTGLVHEAYLGLVGDRAFNDRQNFFRVAAEARRQILVNRARRRKRLQ